MPATSTAPSPSSSRRSVMMPRMRRPTNSSRRPWTARATKRVRDRSSNSPSNSRHLPRNNFYLSWTPCKCRKTYILCHPERGRTPESKDPRNAGIGIAVGDFWHEHDVLKSGSEAIPKTCRKILGSNSGSEQQRGPSTRAFALAQDDTSEKYKTSLNALLTVRDSMQADTTAVYAVSNGELSTGTAVAAFTFVRR